MKYLMKSVNKIAITVIYIYIYISMRKTWLIIYERNINNIYISLSCYIELKCRNYDLNLFLFKNKTIS